MILLSRQEAIDKLRKIYQEELSKVSFSFRTFLYDNFLSIDNQTKNEDIENSLKELLSTDFVINELCPVNWFQCKFSEANPLRKQAMDLLYKYNHLLDSNHNYFQRLKNNQLTDGEIQDIIDSVYSTKIKETSYATGYGMKKEYNQSFDDYVTIREIEARDGKLNKMCDDYAKKIFKVEEE